MASVKWLTRDHRNGHQFPRLFSDFGLSFWEQRDELPVQLLPVSEVEVKAEIARPAWHEIIRGGHHLPRLRRGMDRRVGGERRRAEH